MRAAAKGILAAGGVFGTPTVVAGVAMGLLLGCTSLGVAWALIIGAISWLAALAAIVAGCVAAIIAHDRWQLAHEDGEDPIWGGIGDDIARDGGSLLSAADIDALASRHPDWRGGRD